MLLFQEAGKKELRSQFKEYEMLFYDCLDSTNTECQRKYQEDANPRWLILADSQTGGRGRYGRVWQSKPNINIYLSFMFTNPFYLDVHKGIGYLNLFLGITLYESISALWGNFHGNLTTKWPNDLYVGDKKMAGILLQSVDMSLETIIAGIGINIYANASQIPETATSLYLELTSMASERDLSHKQGLSDHPRARLDTLCHLLHQLQPEMVEKYRKNPEFVLQKFWEYSLQTRTHNYWYTSSCYKQEGIVQKLNEDGTIEICTRSGETIRLSN